MEDLKEGQLLRVGKTVTRPVFSIDYSGYDEPLPKQADQCIMSDEMGIRITRVQAEKLMNLHNALALQYADMLDIDIASVRRRGRGKQRGLEQR